MDKFFANLWWVLVVGFGMAESYLARPRRRRTSDRG